MDIFFNELSVYPNLNYHYSSSLSSIIKTFSITIKEANLHGFKKVRYKDSLDKVMLSETQSIKSFCSMHSKEDSVRLIRNGELSYHSAYHVFSPDCFKSDCLRRWFDDNFSFDQVEKNNIPSSSDKGYGLVVKTTAKNYYQNLWIAEYLKRNYCK